MQRRKRRETKEKKDERMDTNIQKYMAFIKTVECGSFTRAAQSLCYSQSGVSRMILDLESEWGLSLLERNKSGVKLTSDGMKLLPYARRVCEEYNRLQAQVDELKGMQSGLIRIGTFSSVATHWLPRIIKAFQRDYPNIEYELIMGNYEEIEKWIIEGRVDCGFLRLPSLPELDCIFLEEDELLAVVSEDHPMANEEFFPISALADYPFMMLNEGNNSDVEKLIRRYKLPMQIRCTTWDDYAIMAMAELGLGISVLPRLILQRAPYRIVAKRLEIPEYRKIAVALRDRKSSSLAVERFLDYLDFRSLSSDDFNDDVSRPRTVEFR